MKIIALVGFVFALIGFQVYSYLSREDFVKINDPCSSFVTQYTPPKTPRIEGTVGNQKLVISLSPALTDEVSEIISSTRRGVATLETLPGERKLSGVTRGSNGGIVIPISTKKNAVAILEDLCFKKEDIGEL